MKKTALISLLALFTAISAPVQAAQSTTDWFQRDHIEPTSIVRFRISAPLGFAAEDETYNVGGVPIPSEGDNALSSNSIGFQASYTYFFSSRFALELAGGVQFGNNGTIELTSTGGLGSGGTSSTATREGSIRYVPMDAILQYHIAPYGDLTPYVGAGYNYTYFIQKKDFISYDAASGPVLQAGADYWKDRIGINFDVKKYFWNTFNGEYEWAQAALGAPLTSEVESQPWIFSLGINYRF